MNKMEDSSLTQKLFQEENNMMDRMHSQYMDKITSMNNRIYNNARRLNKYITGSESDLYSDMNDINFNKKLMEMHRKEKHDELFNPMKQQIQEQMAKQNKEYNEFMFKDKLNRQKNYKDILDHQNEIKKAEFSKSTTLKDSGEQLLMPSYRYPNLPRASYKKAFDSLSYIARTPIKKDLYVNQSLGNKSGYLGETLLRHNPITCPVDDYEYNKYVRQARNMGDNNYNYNNRNVNRSMSVSMNSPSIDNFDGNVNDPSNNQVMMTQGNNMKPTA